MKKGRLEEVMKELGITKLQISKMLDVSIRTVYRWLKSPEKMPKSSELAIEFMTYSLMSTHINTKIEIFIRWDGTLSIRNDEITILQLRS